MTETRPFFENFMGKPEMQQTFGFKLPFIVEEHENQRVQIHFLEVFTHSQVLVEVFAIVIDRVTSQSARRHWLNLKMNPQRLRIK